jgi:hypothetical protein
MEYNIVTNYQINQVFKSNSKYYRVNLGYASTKENNAGDRIYDEKDSFAFFYNNLYRTTVQGQGQIGNIKFYTDHYIKEEKLAFYFDKEEFIFDFDEKLVKEKGVDFYLGHLIKQIEEELRVRTEEDEKKKEEEKVKKGNADIIFQNPGAVKYEDLKAYMDKKNADRLKI